MQDKEQLQALGAYRADQGKLRIDLIPAVCLEEIAKVFTFGATKYGVVNWQKGMDWSRAYASTLRHIFAWARGQDVDPESGISHLAHAISNLIFLLFYTQKGIGLDDRSQYQ